ncbi:hypothetical protein E4656_01110 [Natronospirillum operosum]|uniref:Uncharacterized protein n=1 Tax=Natronospirillum operosum TaxID=2759953 RepID=A0A4Z0WEK9_9GAMM|nr:hypothetical protein [Natronospirillum operosum]TGG95058.1 hypothetical protein E4656_01110 [Natronospirillum operosum]
MTEDWMVAIPQGEIHLRDDRKKTSRRSEIAQFQMSITQAVYSKIMSRAPAAFIIRQVALSDAEAIPEVLRWSIAEVCHADHKGDKALLHQWLANKTPDSVTK